MGKLGKLKASKVGVNTLPDRSLEKLDAIPVGYCGFESKGNCTPVRS